MYERNILTINFTDVSRLPCFVGRIGACACCSYNYTRLSSFFPLPQESLGTRLARAAVASYVPRLSNYCAEMRGREREPGIHCKFTRLISREFYGFVNSPYSSVNDDTCARSLVYSIYTLQTYYFIVRKRCHRSELTYSICYSLSQLRMSDLKLKERQQQAIHAVYNRNVVFFLPSSGRVCLLSFPFWR